MIATRDIADAAAKALRTVIVPLRFLVAFMLLRRGR
jgi:hypothetical protein